MKLFLWRIFLILAYGARLSMDGDKWCICDGPNLMEGYCGFGDTIEEAYCAFLQDRRAGSEMSDSEFGGGV